MPPTILPMMPDRVHHVSAPAPAVMTATNAVVTVVVTIIVIVAINIIVIIIIFGVLVCVCVWMAAQLFQKEKEVFTSEPEKGLFLYTVPSYPSFLP